MPSPSSVEAGHSKAVVRVVSNVIHEKEKTGATEHLKFVGRTQAGICAGSGTKKGSSWSQSRCCASGDQ